MPRDPNFYSHLSREELEAFEAFARKPGCKIDQLRDWLLAKGVTEVSRSAVARWKRRFDETDRMSAAAELADAIHQASDDAGAVDVAGAVNLQLAQRLQMALVRGGDKLEMGDLLKGAMAINAMTNAQGRIIEMKRKQTEAIKAAEETAKSGGSGEAVALRVREILGIK